MSVGKKVSDFADVIGGNDTRNEVRECFHIDTVCTGDTELMSVVTSRVLK